SPAPAQYKISGDSQDRGAGSQLAPSPPGTSPANGRRSMFLTFEDRPSDSPFVERVWRARTIDGGVFHSIAESNLELVITRLPGLTRVTLRGPFTKPSMVDCPANGQWIAIRFRLGTYLPRIPTALLLDHNSLELLVTADA